jgi:hypothetical protein
MQRVNLHHFNLTPHEKLSLDNIDAFEKIVVERIESSSNHDELFSALNFRKVLFEKEKNIHARIRFNHDVPPKARVGIGTGIKAFWYIQCDVLV